MKLQSTIDGIDRREEKSRVRVVFKPAVRPCDLRRKPSRQTGAKIICTCGSPDCGKEFQAVARDVRRGRGLYCSRSCALRARQTHFSRPIVEQNPEEHINLLIRTVKRWTNIRPVQDAIEFGDGYLGLHSACKSFRGPSSFTAYAESIISTSIRQGKNRLLRRGKRTTMFCGEFDPVGMNCPADQAAQREVSQAIADAINSIPEPDRTYLREHYLEGYSHSEIAKKNGVRRVALETAQSRHLSAIAAMLERFRADFQNESAAREIGGAA